MNKLSILLLSMLLVGCATAQSYQKENLQEAMNANIGKMTYDEALSKLGQPTRVTDGDKIFVAEWITNVQPVPFSNTTNVTTNVSLLNEPSRNQGGFISGFFNGMSEARKKRIEYQRSLPHGSKIVFSFNKETRKLVSWNVSKF